MNIDISKITSCGSDWETNRYTFLNIIKSWQSELRKNKLYPVFDYSLQLQNKFISILNENIESKDWLEREVRGAFINDQLVVLEKAHQISSQLDRLIDFVKWGIDINKEVIEEGEIIHQFVYDSIDIISVCEADKYKGKGYIFIPDNQKRLLKIFLYELSITWLVDEPEEFLELNILRSIPFEVVDVSHEDVINKFIKYNKQLYDPMVYLCKTDIDFPFNETVIPVIKSKLLESVNGFTPYI
jgi:hypothetical protein